MRISRQVKHFAFWGAVALLLSCADQNAVDYRSEANSPNSQDEFVSFIPQEGDEAGIRGVLQGVRDAYVHCDKRPLLSLFSNDFEQAVIGTSNQTAIFNRSSFFAGPTMHDVPDALCKQLGRQISMARIKILPNNEMPDRIYLSTFTTYKSKYFATRLWEIYRFKRDRGSILLEQRAIVPLHPEKPELNSASLYVTELADFQSNLQMLDQTTWDDLDFVLESTIVRKRYRYLPLDNTEKAVIMVFRESPGPTDIIKITHAYYSFSGRFYSKFQEEATNSPNNPWFYFVTTSAAFFRGSVVYKVGINGAQIASSTVMAE